MTAKAPAKATRAKRATPRKAATATPRKGKTAGKATAARKTTAKTPTRSRAARTPPKVKEQAEKIAAHAKSKGATGRKLSTAQRQLRDSAIVARSAAGWTAVMIADEFDLNERQVRRILTERAAVPSGVDDAPMELLEETLRGFRASVGDFEAMAHRYQESHPNVALGAKRAANDAREHYVGLLSAVGKLPDNLELFRSESVLRQLADAMVEMMERVEAGEATPVEAGEFFRSLVAGNETTRRKAIGAGG